MNPITALSEDQRDQLAEDMLPAAGRLAFAVHVRDTEAVADTLTPLNRGELYALAVVLAGFVDIDRAPDVLLAWLDADPPPTPRIYVRPVSPEQAAANRAALEEATSLRIDQNRRPTT